MTDQFVGEIRIFAGNFAPAGWALCNGQLMAISQNTALFSLLGTYYGGDGRSTFGLPNLQAASPLHVGSSAGPGLSQRYLGESGGEPTVSVLASEMPGHTHSANGSATAGGQNSPAGALWAEARSGKVAAQLYGSGTPDTQMAVTAVGVTGGGQPHNNLPPYLVLNFIIALQGIYPARS